VSIQKKNSNILSFCFFDVFRAGLVAEELREKEDRIVADYGLD
jgi:hypothetical protein